MMVQTICRKAMQQEMVYLKEKVDAGAAFVITQMFLDAQVFLDFVQESQLLSRLQKVKISAK